MLEVDWWSWKCVRCGFIARSALTVNPQQSVAQAIIRAHVESHDVVEVVTEPAAKEAFFADIGRP